MAANDIEQRIKLTGEKEYNAALKEARRNLKTLRSELKAETAELGANATAQEKNAAKIKSLKKQIDEQKKIVETNKKALQEVKDQYADNADAIAKYEQKLNESRAALANMQNELDRVGKEFKDVGTNAAQATVATKSVADALGSIGDIGESVSSAIESVFTGLVTNVRDVCLQIWDLISETASKADRWGDLAGFYGSTAEEVQLIDRAISDTGASFEEFIGLMNMLQFKGKDKGLVDWLGLSSVNYDNEIQHAMEALSLLNEKKEQLGTGKFNRQLGEIFGGKSAGLVELIDKYPKIIDKIYELKEKKGYLLNEEELETMSAVQEEIASIRGKWDELKTHIGAGFGKVTLDITAGAEGVLDALAEYLNASTDDERNEALKKLEENLTNIFVTLGDAIMEGIKVLDKVAGELQQSDNPIVKGLGTVLTAIVDMLEWLTIDNANNFRTALIILAGAWGASEVMKMVATIGELAGNLATLKTARTLSSLSNILSGGGGMAAAGSAAGAAWGGAFGSAVMAASPFLSWMFNFLGAGTGSVVTGASSVFGPIADWLTHESPIAPVLNGTQTLSDFAEEQKQNIEDNAKTFKEDWENNGLVKGAEWLIDNWKKNGEQTAEYWKGIFEQQQQASEWILPDDATAEDVKAFVEAMQKVQEIVEDVDLDEKYTDEQKSDAVQDWWDAWRENAEDEENNLEWMKEVFGDEFGTVWDTIMQRLDELGDKQMELEDLPADWWQTQGGNTGNTDGLTTQDARTMTAAINGMPGAVAKGMSGVKVYMDSTVVGNLVADQVSRQIASYVIG